MSYTNKSYWQRVLIDNQRLSTQGVLIDNQSQQSCNFAFEKATRLSTQEIDDIKKFLEMKNWIIII